MEQPSHPSFRLAWRPGVALRFVWLIVSLAIVETLVFGLAIVPAALFWGALAEFSYGSPMLRTVVLSLAITPSYLIFAVSLMILSAFSTKALRWRTPADAEMPVADVGWPVITWARYMVSTHVVRLFAGSVLRATPMWTFYLRMNGAKLGRGVYVNSLTISDHNLLEFDDYVVIGDGVHLSGHTVERGIVKTGRVRLGRGATVGLCAVVGIDVEAGPRCQIGPLSLVPKHTRLDGDASYFGTPVVRIGRTRKPAVERAADRARAMAEVAGAPSTPEREV